MTQPAPAIASHEQIAALRAARGESLAAFSAVIGCSSKGRASEMERGLAQPTVAQAIRLEELSAGRIDAATLNADVAAARRVLGVWRGEDRTHGAASAINDDLPDWALDEAELAALPASNERVIVCAVCELRLDGVTVRGCTFVDCPHAGSHTGESQAA